MISENFLLEVQAFLKSLNPLAETEAVADRLLNCMDQGEFIQVNLASEALDLARKIKIEEAIHEAWPFNHVGKPRVNFRRRGLRQPDESSTEGEPMMPPQRSTKIEGFGIRPKRASLPGVDRIIVIYSAKGGVGKSTMTHQLAQALTRQGFRTGILDADLQGPSFTRLMDVQGPMDVDDQQRLIPKIKDDISVVSFGFFMNQTTPFMSRGPIVTKTLQKLIFGVHWGELDYLLIDLPPGTGDVPMTIVEELAIDGAVIVTTPHELALEDAHKGLSLFEKLEVPILGFIENLSMHTCRHCGHQERLFGDQGESFAEQRGIAMLGRIPIAATLARLNDREGAPELDDLFDDLCRRIIDFI